MEALDYQRLADMCLGDDEIVDVEVVIVLRVRNRGLQALAHVLGDALARELEVRKRTRDLLAANERRHEIELARAYPDRPHDSLGFRIGQRTRMFFLAHRR